MLGNGVGWQPDGDVASVEVVMWVMECGLRATWGLWSAASGGDSFLKQQGLVLRLQLAPPDFQPPGRLLAMEEETHAGHSHSAPSASSHDVGPKLPTRLASSLQRLAPTG